MKRVALTGLTLAAVLAAGGGGYWAGTHGAPAGGHGPVAAASPTDAGPVIYYRDPDGQPFYSPASRQTADGRPFRPVYATEDVSFEDRPPTAASGSGAANPRRVLYYRNPMGLPDTSPVPKKDSMGMDYIAVYEGEADEDGVVRVSPGKLQRTGVRSQFVERRVVSSLVRVPGAVQLDERRIAVVATRSDAFIEEVANVTTGERVTKGQALLRLYSPEIAVASAQFLTELNTPGRDPAFGGARQRLENLGVPPDAIAEIERSRRPLLAMTWRAPRDGIVLERNAINGMKAAPGDVLFRIADISTIWVLANVQEYELGAIHLGARATIRLRGAQNEPLEGRVSLIYPQVDEATRTAKVRIELANPAGRLLPNMYADVEIGTGAPDPVIAVPDNAVIASGTRQIVILDRGEGRFEPRAVTTGNRGDGFIEIREGLASSDRVVVAANFLIDAESNLQAALRGLAASESQP